MGLASYVYLDGVSISALQIGKVFFGFLLFRWLSA